MGKKSLSRAGRLTLAVLGTGVMALAINGFVVPAGLYSGGLMGLCQLIRTLLLRSFPLKTGAFDFAGLLYLLLNIPLFLLGRRGLGRQFFHNTLLCTLSYSLFLSLIPVPVRPLVEDTLTACLLGGILAGFGVGVVLTCGCSTGGLDVLGLWLAKGRRGFTVGRFVMAFNGLLYALCLLLLDTGSVIYSVIYTTFQAVVMDRAHQQNVSVQALIFTREDGERLQQYIMGTLGRGVTRWEGEGSFTHRGIHILCTVLSKDEVNELRQVIHQADPGAFVIFQEGVRVEGNFHRRLA